LLYDLSCICCKLSTSSAFGVLAEQHVVEQIHNKFKRVEYGLNKQCVFVKQSFKIKQAVTDDIVNATEMDRPLANGDVHHDVRSSGILTTCSVNNGYKPTTYDSRPVDHIKTDSTPKLIPSRRNAISESVTLDCADHELNVRQQPVYNQPPVYPSPSSSCSTTSINCISTSITTTTMTTANNSSTSVTNPFSVTQKVGHMTPIYSQTQSAASVSEILRRSTLPEVRSSGASKGRGSAVARLFGTSSVPPVSGRGSTLSVLGGGTSPGARGGRRSLHHSWVRPGRSVFSDTETLTSTRAEEAVTPTASDHDDTPAQNHC